MVCDIRKMSETAGSKIRGKRRSALDYPEFLAICKTFAKRHHIGQLKERRKKLD